MTRFDGGEPQAADAGAPVTPVVHTYIGAGVFTARLTVTDTAGLSSQATANSRRLFALPD